MSIYSIYRTIKTASRPANPTADEPMCTAPAAETLLVAEAEAVPLAEDEAVVEPLVLVAVPVAVESVAAEPVAAALVLAVAAEPVVVAGAAAAAPVVE